MDDPFSGEFASAPRDQVFANMDPVVTLVLTRMDALAISIREMTGGTLQAVIQTRDQASNEVAVHLLLAGTGTIMAAYRPLFEHLGQQMRSAVRAVAAAWTVFGTTGKWVKPPGLTPLAMPIPDVRIEPRPTRPLGNDENIDANYTKEFLGHIRAVGDSFADAARDTLIRAVRNQLPVGDLADSIDVAMVEHTRVLAELTTSLRDDLHLLVDAVQTSCHTHTNTNHWVAPVVMRSPRLLPNTENRIQVASGMSPRWS